MRQPFGHSPSRSSRTVRASRAVTRRRFLGRTLASASTNSRKGSGAPPAARHDGQSRRVYQVEQRDALRGRHFRPQGKLRRRDAPAVMQSTEQHPRLTFGRRNAGHDARQDAPVPSLLRLDTVRPGFLPRRHQRRERMLGPVRFGQGSPMAMHVSELPSESRAAFVEHGQAQAG